MCKLSCIYILVMIYRQALGGFIEAEIEELKYKDEYTKKPVQTSKYKTMHNWFWYGWLVLESCNALTQCSSTYTSVLKPPSSFSQRGN